MDYTGQCAFGVIDAFLKTQSCEGSMIANAGDQEPQSFILKIWIEETGEEAEHVTWRGHITHVPSNSRRYIEDLDEIALFIAPYLQRLGVKLKQPRRLRFRLPRPKTRVNPTE